MSSKDPNKKYYFEQVQFDELSRILKGSTKIEMKMAVWSKGEEPEQAEEFELTGFEPANKKMTLAFEGGFLSKLSGSKHANCDVLVKIPDGKIHYFTGGFLHYDKIEKVYQLEIKEDVYCSKQRSNYRLMANTFNTIQFKINETVYDGLDVSAGGTSIMISDEQREIFAKDKIFTGCTLRFNRVNFDIPKARIAGAWEQKDKNGNILPEIKIGIAFESLTSGTEEALFKHINSEARMEEVRKRFG
jgi:hypothetical protein